MKFMMMLITCLLILSMSGTGNKYPDNEFLSPVNRQIKLSGTFGELRTNHFHAGLDIKTANGVAGDPVYATQAGYVSRIKVEPFGYGNALYINHPNGFTSVYAHLDKFEPFIEQFVINEQYKAKSFEVDLNPDPGALSVSALQQIGIMGNTGSSFGAHLHFEIRHTRNQVPINPLHFGFDVLDRKAPVIQQLIVYQYNEKGDVLSSKVLQPALLAPGQYGFHQTLELADPKVSFGLRTYDMQDGTSNHNGVYSIQCTVDGEPSFEFALDEIPFEKSRYLNAHIDYARKVNENKLFHRCHPLEGNRLPIYKAGLDNGMIYLNAEQSRQISIAVSDFKGNISTIKFNVVRNHDLTPVRKSAPVAMTMALHDQVNMLSQPGLQVLWPIGSFYEKTPLQVDIIPSDGLGSFSPHYLLTPVDIPVHYYFDLLIEGLAVPTQLQEKAFIARCEPNGRVVNCGGKWIGNNLTTSVREMSTYTIMVDTIPPTIAILHFGSKMTGWSRMAFKISDNFGIKDRGRDLRFEAKVDGAWILMSLDGKSGVLTHQFDGRIPPGDHQLQLKVTDDRGNETLLKKSFTL